MQAYSKDRRYYDGRILYYEKALYGTAKGTVHNRKIMQKYLSGYRNPLYKVQIRDLHNATTGFVGQHDRVLRQVPMNWVAEYRDHNSSDSTIYRDFLKGFFSLPGHLGSIPPPGDLNNKALTRFFLSIRRAQVAYSAPTALGELRETLRMIRSPAKALRQTLEPHISRAATAKRRYPKMRGPEFRQAIADSWLETSFGWIPFINDLKQLMRTYQDALNKPRMMRVNGFAIDQNVKDQFIVGSSNYTNIRYDTSHRTIGSRFVKYRGVVACETEGVPWNNWDLFGFTPSEFIPTAWELLPWSFLLDYFSNIGEILEAGVTSLSGLKWYCKSDVSSQTSQTLYSPNFEKTHAVLGKLISLSKSPGYVEWRSSNVSRSVPQLEYPTLRFELPGHGAQFANMLALFISANKVHPQHFRGRFPNFR